MPRASAGAIVAAGSGRSCYSTLSRGREVERVRGGRGTERIRDNESEGCSWLVSREHRAGGIERGRLEACLSLKSEPSASLAAIYGRGI